MNPTPPCAALVHEQFRSAIQERIQHGDANEARVAELLLSIYDRSCEIPRVAQYIDEWARGVLT